MRGKRAEVQYEAVIVILLVIAAAVAVGYFVIYKPLSTATTTLDNTDLATTGIIKACELGGSTEADYCNRFREVKSTSGSVKGYVTCRYLEQNKSLLTNITATAKAYNCDKYNSLALAIAQCATLKITKHSEDKTWKEFINEQLCNELGYTIGGKTYDRVDETGVALEALPVVETPVVPAPVVPAPAG
jgi:hypothetical protein